jgi:hypothetical protein
VLQIQGVIQLIPSSIATEAGSLRVDETQTQPAVVQSISTLNGIVQVVYPTSAIDEVIKGLQAAKKEAEETTPSTDLYIPQSMAEADNIAKAQREIKQELSG